MKDNKIIREIINSGIESDIIPISALKGKIYSILKEEFGLSALGLNDWAKYYLSELRKDLMCFIEYPYIDKVYRDDYYSYFSTKFRESPRDTLRISFFESPLSSNDFREKEEEKILSLQQKYLGFIIIRPTEPQLAGRSIISPKAYNKSNFIFCYANFSSAINGVKFTIDAFPHASQDGESMTCAETSIWALMEYFGNKYPEYRQLLPSQIRKILVKHTQERQLPSQGLSEEHISYVLKKMGFGARIYEKGKKRDEERNFNRLIAYHIESGIPVVAGIENKKIGHAVLIIGHEELNPYSINNCKAYKTKNGIKIYDTADIKKSYVIIDDNYPPYKMSQLENLEYYNNDKEMKGAQIISFVAPLHQKIYKEAVDAKNLSIDILTKSFFGFNKNFSTAVIFRFFLASSRSYKNFLIQKSSLNSSIKEIILSRPMPKFVYISEITLEKEYNDKKALGLIIIDATEPSNNAKKALLLTITDNTAIINDKGKYKKIQGDIIKISPFEMYISNLKK